MLGFLFCPLKVDTNWCTVGKVKRKKLENELKKLGWWFLRHGGNHDVWTDGNRQEPIPRHSDINEKLVRSIIRKAKRGVM
jgi:mRNA interferase HicA